YWCEFSPAYGFHAGYVHPVPRTHGCLRLHKTVAPKFFALVREGTPVYIAQNLPEDRKFAAQVERPTDYRDPDPPAEYMISTKVFEQPNEAHILESQK
ncbi:MAG: L,D-transpeptidase, partial [Verrucomicrobiota bacterium]